MTNTALGSAAPSFSGNVRRPGSLLLAIVVLCVAGGMQEVVLLLHAPGLGIWVVAPSVVLVAALWRPSPEMTACVLLALGLEALLYLHTGGTRYSDWLLHYELARHYGGLSNSTDPALIPGRTPLFQLLTGAFLAHTPAFAVFQVLAVLLNSLWLWPAGMLLQRGRNVLRPGRLVTIAVGPFVLAYSVYTWPWGLCAFFLLGAVWFSLDEGLISAVGAGAAMAAALLVHPGALGYVVGLALYLAFRRKHVVATLVTGAAISATAIPWVLSVSGGGDLGRMVRASVPARQAVGPLTWLATRALTAATSFYPIVPVGPDRPAINWLIAFFVLTLPGALALTLVPLGRLPRLPAAALAMLLGGTFVDLLIYPANNALTGMLDALYPGVLLLLILTLGAARGHAVAWAAVLNIGAGLVFAGCLLWVSNWPAPTDANLGLKVRFGVRFIADEVGLLPGAVLVLSAAWLIYLTFDGAVGWRAILKGKLPRPGADVSS